MQELDKHFQLLMKKEKQRLKKQRYKESLNREEALDDYEKTNSYVQKGGHVLRKRDRLARRQYVVDEQPREIVKKILPPTKTKDKMEKRKKKKLRKKLKRQQDRASFQEVKRQYQEQKKLDRQQEVPFRPSQELFEKDLIGKEDHNFDSQKDVGHSKGTQPVKARNNRRRVRRREVSEADVYERFKKQLPKGML